MSLYLNDIQYYIKDDNLLSDEKMSAISKFWNKTGLGLGYSSAIYTLCALDLISTPQFPYL